MIILILYIAVRSTIRTAHEEADPSPPSSPTLQPQNDSILYSVAIELHTLNRKLLQNLPGSRRLRCVSSPGSNFSKNLSQPTSFHSFSWQSISTLLQVGRTPSSHRLERRQSCARSFTLLIFCTMQLMTSASRSSIVTPYVSSTCQLAYCYDCRKATLASCNLCAALAKTFLVWARVWPDEVNLKHSLAG
jgi:hypothetical protein